MHRHRTIMIQSLVKFYDIVETNEYYIKPADKDLFVDACSQFQLHYQWLAKQAMYGPRTAIVVCRAKISFL